MANEMQQVDAFNEASGTGVLGRMLDVLQKQGLSVASTSLTTRSIMTEGNPSTRRQTDIMPGTGPSKLYERDFTS